MTANIDRFIGGLTTEQTEEVASAALFNLPLDRAIAVILRALDSDARAELAAALDEQGGE